MRAPAITALLATAGSFVTAAPASQHHGKRLVDYEWGSTKVRGVNIGGWLVLEPFITPSIFAKYNTADAPVADEWTLCQKLGKQGCFDALKPHWDSFVSLSDFEKIKQAGFNVVRIPIGYWAYMDFGGTYTSGSAPYLDKAVEWARQTGLKIIIDLHGAPQSQNGFDHSGQKLGAPGWGQGDSIAQTLEVLGKIEGKYAVQSMQDVVVGIQFLNEPYLAKLDPNMVKQFYRDAFFSLRQSSDTTVVLHDGFFDPSWLNGFLTPSDSNAQYVVVDHHEYQIFDSNLVAMSTEQHLGLTCDAVNNWATSDKWTIVGEWSGALTDCAPHLNGFGAGNRLEGSFPGSWYIGSCAGKSGPVSSWSQEWKDDIRKYIETQLDAFEAKTNGWVFWNFKTEGSAGEWDLFQLLDNGVFPQPLDDRKFGKHCTNF